MTERRLPLFVAALAAGASYHLADHLVAPGVGHIVWKGAGVGLLALWAAGLARSVDGRLVAAVMAFGAAGDVLLDAAGMIAGAAAFLAGHCVAIGLYLRNRRADPSRTQRLFAATLLVMTPLAAWLLSRDVGVAVYATGLGAMAATAWLSRFSRYRVGIGAVLFVVSDWLIFARAGPMASSVLPDLAIWPAYFAGQALIAWGVATRCADEGLHDRI